MACPFRNEGLWLANAAFGIVGCNMEYLSIGIGSRITLTRYYHAIVESNTHSRSILNPKFMLNEIAKIIDANESC